MTAAAVTLDAVRQAELRVASGEADEIRRAADGRVQGIVAQARADADALITRRCAAAERLAALEERERLAQARTQAREIVLRAQRLVLTDAVAAAHAAARKLAADARLERLLEQLAIDARERLASAGSVETIAASDGGFVARLGSREIDYSIHSQVDRILEEMASELEHLWR